MLATGTTVTIPNNQYVSAALAGQTITAPNAAVAAGLAAGFSALGLPYVWGGGGSGAGPNNGCARGGGDYNSCGTTIGFDCSGLTAYVLGMAGYQTPGDSGSQRAAGAVDQLGARRCPATSSASPATSRSTSAPSAVGRTSSRRPGSARRSTSSR